MNEKQIRDELSQTSHIVILISYTILSVILIGESLLLGWETWALILIAVGLCIAWILHIRQTLSTYTRQWIYSVMMMATFFFYGIHPTSTYDLCGVMGAVIMIYSMTGVEALIYLCQGTYIVTFLYGIIAMAHGGEALDALMITRSLLHVGLILLMGRIARVIIDRWGSILSRVKGESFDLKRQIERLNDFLVNISHEIRTPVNAIIGLAGVCAKEETNEKIRGDLASVSDAGKKIGELMGDILDYSEIDMNRLAVSTEEYMLSSLMSDIVVEITPHMNEEVELVIDVDSGIPSVMRTDVGKLKKILKHLIDNSIKYTREGGIYVHLFAERRDYGINLCIEVSDTGIGMSAKEIERVFDRFFQADSGRARTTSGLGLGLSIVNGFVRSLNGFLTLESEPGKGTSVRVSIPQEIVDDQKCMSLKASSERTVGSYFHFEKYPHPQVRHYYNAMVRDLTIGLDVKMQRADNIEGFRKLARATHFTHVFVGKEEYEEDVEFFEELAKETLVVVVADHSFRPGRNTNVRVLYKPFYCFPVIAFLNKMKGEEEEEEGRLYTRGVKALVVDDEPMNHMVAREVFGEYGMEVHSVMSGEDAITAVSDTDYDIVFMDHMMPGMDGVEAMKRIRARMGRLGKDMPIVALTANAVSTAKEMFLREGFDGFIAKPIEIFELERVLRKVLPKSMITIEVESGTHGGSSGAGPSAENGSSGGPFAELENHGVNTKTGMTFCQNDREFYGQMLAQYGSEGEKKHADLDRYLAAGDLKNYEVLIHSVKSSSKMIGAMDLFERARQLEEAAKAGDGETIRRDHGGVMADYDGLTGLIRLLFGGPAAGDATDGAGASPDDDILEFAAEEAPEDGITEFVPEAGEEPV
ncbi:MAG: response regulator [Lachnospiraceae bacterium]|nr:response regulator [Lachnospiraceae bacterium]